MKLGNHVDDRCADGPVRADLAVQCSGPMRPVALITEWDRCLCRKRKSPIGNVASPYPSETAPPIRSGL